MKSGYGMKGAAGGAKAATVPATKRGGEPRALRSHPTLYQLNTRVLLHERGRELGRPATLDDLPDEMLDQIATWGFSWVWMLGVWQTSEAARQVALHDPQIRAALAHDLPDLRDEDIVGSPFAVTGYDVERDFGDDAALARLRARLATRGLSLMLDFVPNHVAIDHPWVTEHPAYLVHGSGEDLASQPYNYFRRSSDGPVLAHGRDPYFAGWTDTAQLNYRHGGLREAQITQLGRIADRCDGVRCDMALLLAPDVIERTWGARSQPADGTPPCDRLFWNDAIPAIRRRYPQFVFLAEVYWDREWELQQAGFDFTYDKRLYDRLIAGEARPVREHLMAEPAFRDRCARFLENHDEPRAATAFPRGPHQAAAVVALLAPGLRLLHEGQLDGRHARVPMQLRRRLTELVDPEVRSFYDRLLAVLARAEAHEGQWQLCLPLPAWAGNSSHDGFIAFLWQRGENRLLAVANYAPTQAQCYLPLPNLTGGPFTLSDCLNETVRYDRSGLDEPGLYLDLPAWGHHVFEIVGPSPRR